MSYVQAALLPGESVEAQAKTHWFIYVAPACWLVLSIIVLNAGSSLVGVLLLLWSLFLFFRAGMYQYSTELAVTTKRIVAKFGFIRRNTVELSHGKVESLHVKQGIFGRIFDFGSVVVTGSGGTHAPIPYIACPLKFRSAALTAIEAPKA